MSDKYVKLTQLEHILKRPDTYIGSIEFTSEQMWIIDSQNKLVQKNITFVPGFFKIFDEILVNAADNKIRDPSMKKIEVIIDPEQNMIQVKNDGKGIPVEIHSKEKIFVPELIFGHLLTSSNYDDNEKKVVGGRNGYGAKLCNIFSTLFELETADKSHEKVYRQVWRDNMSICEKPKITKFTKKSGEFTRIAFKPDLAKFGMTKLEDDFVGLLKRRVYDIAGCVKGVAVYLNGEKVPVKDFKSYVELYLQSVRKNPKSEEQEEKEEKEATDIKEDRPVIVYDKSERWEVAFGVSEDVFRQVSFVNSIATTSGGTHVNNIADQIVNKTLDYLKKKHKNAHIKPFQIRNNMFLFVNCLIENPAFTSQTKEQMITKASAFGSKFQVSEDFIKKVIKTDFIQQILDIAQQNADKELRKTDGSGRRNRVVISGKLEDANKAGTRESERCTLILTEGDSAKALAMSGLKIVGRDYYGVFPLKGKLLNVRDATTDQIMKNQEIKNIKKIMGLQHKKQYDSVKGLRYGHIMIMADQDHDGSHIKGLIMNFIEMSFPGLLDIPGFLLEFITPIVKVTITRTKEKKLFYNMPEFENWLATEGRRVKFTHKYYKGLGTSDTRDMMQYFNNLDHHIKKFDIIKTEDKDLFELAFAKKKADERKNWLAGFEPGTHLDATIRIIPYDQFINKELILFSMADNVRSIPSLCDGLKPAQRKVLYTLFKKNISKEIKVNDLQGYVSSTTNYHHGEASLVQTIVGLAQDFIGSNNIYLLNPNGCFGTRDVGGKDHAAARYIFTELNQIARHIFKSEDAQLLHYVEDDDATVEPLWYMPIIPMVLVNGSEGIGTGWSTSIPQFNPRDIVRNLRKLLAGEDMVEMVPWYRNWRGTIFPAGPDKFKMFGKIEKVDDKTLIISEIPAKTWTQNIKEFIENSLVNTTSEKQCEKFIQDYTEQDDMEGHKFIIILSADQMQKTERLGYYERFRLIQNVNLGNMILFNDKGKLEKFDSPLSIIKSYYLVRLEYYQKRKDYLAGIIREQLIQLNAKARFIKLIIDKKLSISNKKRVALVKELKDLNFPRFAKDGKCIKEEVQEADITREEEEIDDEEEEEEDVADKVEDKLTHVPDTIFSSYDYLLKMPLWSLTKERYAKLLAQETEKKAELDLLLTKSAKDLWSIDLDSFDVAYEKFLKEDAERSQLDVVPRRQAKRSRKKNEDDDDFVPGAKKQKKAKGKSKMKEEVLIKGEYIVPELKVLKPKKTKVKKEDSGQSTLNDFVKQEIGSDKENKPKSVFDKSSASVTKTEIDSDSDDDIFSKFNSAASMFDKSIEIVEGDSQLESKAVKKTADKKAAAPKKAAPNKTAPKKAAPKKSAPEKAAVKKEAAPKAKKAKKKINLSDDEDDSIIISDDEIAVDSASSLVSRKPKRAAAGAKKTNYIVDDEDEESLDEDDDFEEDDIDDDSEYDE